MRPRSQALWPTGSGAVEIAYRRRLNMEAPVTHAGLAEDTGILVQSMGHIVKRIEASHPELRVARTDLAKSVNARAASMMGKTNAAKDEAPESVVESAEDEPTLLPVEVAAALSTTQIWSTRLNGNRPHIWP